MATSTASDEHQQQNRYFVNTGIEPFDSLYRKWREIKAEQKRTMLAKEEENVHLKAQVESSEKLAEILKEQIAELTRQLKQEKDTMQGKQGAKIIKLENDIEVLKQEKGYLNSKLNEANKYKQEADGYMIILEQESVIRDALQHSKAEKLLNDTIFACKLLQAALKTVSLNVVKIPKRDEYFNLTLCIGEYNLQEKVEKAQSNLNILKNPEAENVNRILSQIANQQQVVDILNEFILKWAMTEFLERPVFKDVCYHYYNTHVSAESRAPVLVQQILEERFPDHT